MNGFVPTIFFTIYTKLTVTEFYQEDEKTHRQKQKTQLYSSATCMMQRVLVSLEKNARRRCTVTEDVKFDTPHAHGMHTVFVVYADEALSATVSCGG